MAAAVEVREFTSTQSSSVGGQLASGNGTCGVFSFLLLVFSLPSVVGHMTTKKNVAFSKMPPMIFHSAPHSLTIAGFVVSSGGIPGKDSNWGSMPGTSNN
jgi:hypothetical protein